MTSAKLLTVTRTPASQPTKALLSIASTQEIKGGASQRRHGDKQWMRYRNSPVKAQVNDFKDTINQTRESIQSIAGAEQLTEL